MAGVDYPVRSVLDRPSSSLRARDSLRSSITPSERGLPREGTGTTRAYSRLARQIKKKFLDRHDVRAALLQLDQDMRGARGPAATTSMVTVAAGYLAALLEQKPGNAESVARLLAGATPKERKLLGCKGRPPSAHQLRRRIERLETHFLNGSAQGSSEAVRLLQPTLDAIVKASADDIGDDAVLSVDGSLLEANMPNLKGEEIAMALDPERYTELATSRKKILRRIAALEQHSSIGRYIDRDARWRNYDKKLGHKSELGYEIIGAQSYANGREQIQRISICSANQNVVPIATGLVLDIHKENRVSSISCDREFSAKKDSFLSPLRNADIEVVFDLHQRQQGYQGKFHGLLIIDNWLYVPCLPKRLWHLKRPAKETKEPSVEELKYRADVEERSQYAVVFHARLNGHRNLARGMRVASPVQRAKKAGLNIKCPSVPSSMKNAPAKAKLCRAGCKPGEGCGIKNGLAWKADNAPLAYMPMEFGASNWRKAYGPRSAVERIFSRLKTNRGASLARFDLPRGIIRVGFVAAVAAAAANLLPDWNAQAKLIT